MYQKDYDRMVTPFFWKKPPRS